MQIGDLKSPLILLKSINPFIPWVINSGNDDWYLLKQYIFTCIKKEVITDGMKVKKKRDRFNGMSEEEVLKRTLPDRIKENLDILIVSVSLQPK